MIRRILLTAVTTAALAAPALAQTTPAAPAKPAVTADKPATTFKPATKSATVHKVSHKTTAKPAAVKKTAA